MTTCAYTLPCALRQPTTPYYWSSRRRSVTRCTASTSKGFHQSRLALQERTCDPLSQLCVQVREADSEGELSAAAYLRALSFYAYPPERAFAGKLHQQQKYEEEFELLKQQQVTQRLGLTQNERSACMVAVCSEEDLAVVDERLLTESQSLHPMGGLAVVGTLDLHAVRALPGEVLIGNAQNAAYIANVCVSDAVRRRGVGAALIQSTRELAREWGADGLFVHMMAVNEVARRFYANLGFVVEKEESSNDAHGRGHCLDGISGRGRSLLMRNSLL